MPTAITGANTAQPQTAFVIQTAGAHKFSYTKVAADSGQTVWRWPIETPLSQRVQATGSLVDVKA